MLDASLQDSMGPIVDRTKAQLVATDKGFTIARRRLLAAARALRKNGTTPPGVDPAHQRIRSASVILPPDQPFQESCRDAMTVRPGVAPASV